MKVSPLFTTADNEITLESIADGVFMVDHNRSTSWGTVRLPLKKGIGRQPETPV